MSAAVKKFGTDQIFSSSEQKINFLPNNEGVCDLFVPFAGVLDTFIKLRYNCMKFRSTQTIF